MDKKCNMLDQNSDIYKNKSNDDESKWVYYSDENACDDEEDDSANEFAFIEEDDVVVDTEDQYEFIDTSQSHQPKQLNYSVLKEEEIRQLQEDDITKVSAVLSIPKSAACFLLPQFNWRVSMLNEEWFADEDRIREKVGLLRKPVVQFNARDLISCGICFDDYEYESGSVLSAVCGHPFCRDCWTGYITTSINDGPACLMLRCPEPSCSAAVGQDLICMLSTQEDHEKYKRCLLRSYVEGHRMIKWCPAPDCQYAVKYDADDTVSYDVTCLCSNGFCWNCSEEIHRPVDCGTVGKWALKNKDDSQNVHWILVNTKPCPKCKSPIEKNQGCNIMTCRPPCRFVFCWYCLEPFNRNLRCCCNSYRGIVKRGDAEAERDRKKARTCLGRYIHYYERWANNRSSRQKAIEDSHKVKSMHIMKLADMLCKSEFQLKFITEAWQQIVECRQVLQWTYAYGYFIPEDEHLKLQLFEHLQGHAEFSLERLHKCAENDLQQFLSAEGPLESFQDFRVRLIGLTKATANYFGELVRALENGLSEVDTQGIDKH